MNRVLIFAYYSYNDPIFQSAVLPYFVNLPVDSKFVLLTFEKKEFKTSIEEAKSIKEYLLRHNIVWYRLTWHSGRFKILKKCFDLICGLCTAFYLVKKFKIKVVYSEGFPGAVIGHFISQLTRRPHIVHTYEPHAQYMIEANVWSENSWEARLLTKYQKKVAHGASTIITGTHEMAAILKEEGVMAQIIRLPSCVDVEHFRFDEGHRFRIREELKISDKIVILYMGKFGGMYMDDEIFEMFRFFELAHPDSFYFVILTTDPIDSLRNTLKRHAMNPDNYFLTKATRPEVPAFLSAADFGLVPVRQFPSKRLCSPIKDGEYWACELPILIFEGISDDYEFTRKFDLGLTIEQPSSEAYSRLVAQITSLKEDIARYNAMRKRCREFVIQDRSIIQAHKLYSEIFESI